MRINISHLWRLNIEFTCMSPLVVFSVPVCGEFALNFAVSVVVKTLFDADIDFLVGEPGLEFSVAAVSFPVEGGLGGI